MDCTSSLKNNMVDGVHGAGVAPSQVKTGSNAEPTNNTEEGVERTFTIFRKLAPELRLKIWKFALPTEPRYIEVHSIHPGYDPNPDVWTYHYTAKPSTSALFLVNHEAHFVASNHFQRSIRLESSPPDDHPAVYYDPDVDVLCFRADWEDGTYEYWKWFNDMGEEFLGRVKHMAMQCSDMSTDDMYDFSPDDYFSQWHMSELVGLKTVKVARFTDKDQFKYVVVDGKYVDLRDRGTIVGFVEDEEITRSSKFEEHYRFVMTHVGHGWDEDPIPPVRAGWVLPRAVFGDFITEG